MSLPSFLPSFHLPSPPSLLPPFLACLALQGTYTPSGKEAPPPPKNKRKKKKKTKSEKREEEKKSEEKQEKQKQKRGEAGEGKKQQPRQQPKHATKRDGSAFLSTGKSKTGIAYDIESPLTILSQGRKVLEVTSFGQSRGAVCGKGRKKKRNDGRAWQRERGKNLRNKVKVVGG